MVGGGLAQFTGAHAGQYQQPQSQLRLQPTTLPAHALQVLRQFGHAQERVVVDWRQRHSHHIQVGGGVVFKAGHDHQGIAEQLVEPGPDLFCY